MALTRVSSILPLLSVLLLSHYEVHGASILGAMQPEVEERSVKELDTRNLLAELDELEAVEEELSRREEIAELRAELEQILREDRKRQIRQTPVPEVKRLRMTPPPNVPEPMYRLSHTPIPPSDEARRPDPGYPYNLADHPLRETPRPLRITPEPFVAPPVYPQEPVYQQAMAQELWEEMYERNLMMDRRAEERKRNEQQRRTQLSIGFINKPYDRRGFVKK